MITTGLFVTLIVPDYDEALQFFTRVLGFDLVEDTNLGGGSAGWS